MQYRGAFVLGVLAAAFLGCSPPNVAGPPLEMPTTAKAFGSPQCSAVRPPTEPDLMAWDPAQRGALNAIRSQGVAVVRYEAHGCDVNLEVLDNCIAPGKYEFVPYWESDSKTAKNAGELYSSLPIGAAGFKGFDNV